MGFDNSFDHPPVPLPFLEGGKRILVPIGRDSTPAWEGRTPDYTRPDVTVISATKYQRKEILRITR